MIYASGDSRGKSQAGLDYPRQMDAYSLDKRLGTNEAQLHPPSRALRCTATHFRTPLLARAMIKQQREDALPLKRAK